MKKLLTVIIVVSGSAIVGYMGLFFMVEYKGSIDEVMAGAKADAIAVLGAAEYDGKPSPVLQARLDHAYNLYKKGVASFIITTGGIHPGEKISEGDAGKTYLIKKGIPENSIFAEGNSLTTKQNIARIDDIAHAQGFKTIILVSDPFHMYRATIVARDRGLLTLSSPTRTSPISRNFWLEKKYVLRETVLLIAHMLFDV